MSNNNYREVWQYAMDQIHEEYKKEGSQQETEFKLWFNMQYVEDTDNTIIVSVPSEFMWLTMVKKGNVNKVIEKIQEITGQKDILIDHTVSNSKVASQETEEKQLVSFIKPKKRTWKKTKNLPKKNTKNILS